MSQDKLKVLFICSRNQWRSPTAEQVFRRHPALAVRSAGTSASARKQVSHLELAWADVVIVMESKHKSRLLAIPDDYRFMDTELVELLEAAVPPLLGLG